MNTAQDERLRVKQLSPYYNVEWQSKKNSTQNNMEDIITLIKSSKVGKPVYILAAYTPALPSQSRHETLLKLLIF